jgi:hypothetical protein
MSNIVIATIRLQKGCTRLAAASDKVYQLLVHGRWFSPGTPASSIIKTGRHDIAEILLKLMFNIYQYTLINTNNIYGHINSRETEWKYRRTEHRVK